MNFVEDFKIAGVPAKQIPCILLDGPPTTATVGAVGLFGMDESTGTVYKCVSAADGVYTWDTFGGSTPTFDLTDLLDVDLEGTPASCEYDTAELLAACHKNGAVCLLLSVVGYRHEVTLLPVLREDGAVQLNGTLSVVYEDGTAEPYAAYAVVTDGAVVAAAVPLATKNVIGDIETALDSIIAMQEELIGGDS